MATVSDNLKAVGMTAAVVAVAASVLIGSRSTPSQLVKDHTKIARECAANDTGNVQVDDPTYDYVVIGGGTAGCVVASRLSEDPEVKVLLLEAGGSGIILPFSRIPAGYGQLMHTKHDHDLYTVPQANAGNTKKYWPRGKMLGGSSSMNAMMFHIGDKGDYDEWAQIMKGEPGAEQWNWENFKQYFRKFEKYQPHDLHPKFDVTKRGDTGLVQTGFFANFSPISAAWLATCEKLGIPLVEDLNTSAGTMGASRLVYRFLHGNGFKWLTVTYISPKTERVSSEAGYLTPQVLQRPNLKVATHATVTRLLFASKTVVGVEFANEKTKKRYRVKVRREAVLSAGAVHTPQILLLSGIGPASDLTKLGIPVVADLPGVGGHLMDHPAISIRARVKPGLSYTYLRARNIGEHLRGMKALMQYNLYRTGPLTSNVAEAAAFLRSSDEKIFTKDQFPETIEDTASSSTGPDLELFGGPVAWTDHGFGPVAPGDSVCLSVCLLRPTSLGTVTLKSADPFEKPVIDPRYLETRHDIDVLVRGMKLILRMAKTAPFSDNVIPDTTRSAYLDDHTDQLSDAELEKLVRERTETLYHPTSTARMAPLAQNGVIDGNLRVYGIPNLRVADASAFPCIISGHTAAPSFAIGEKAADLIKAGH